MELRLFLHGFLFFPLYHDDQADPVHVPGVDASVVPNPDFQDDAETVLSHHCCYPANMFGHLSSSFLHPQEPWVPTLAGVSDVQRKAAALKCIYVKPHTTLNLASAFSTAEGYLFKVLEENDPELSCAGTG